MGSTREWARPAAAVQALRARWTSADDPFRELKEGWGRERQRWGASAAAVRGRVTLPLLACNTAHVYRTRGGARLAGTGLRRLRQEHRRALGAAPAAISLDGCYRVFALEDLLARLGSPVHQRVMPQRQPGRPPGTPPT